MPEKVTVEYDKVTEALIFLDESGEKLVGVKPTIFYHNLTKEEV